jgi:hypothetical protein
MSERHIGGVPMQAPRREYFPPPRVRAPEPVTYPAPGMAVRVVRQPSEPAPGEPEDEKPTA